VAETSAVRTPAELIAFAKANRGKLTFSSSGVGNPQHLAGELMNKMAGTDVQHVPYRGSAPAVTDVAVGAVSMSFSSLAAALPLIQAGKIRAVAVTSRERMPQLPDVAPLGDAPGLAGYELLNWFAMFAPASASAPVLARLTDVMPRIMQRPDITEKLAIQGIVSRRMTDVELRAFVRAESDKFAGIIQDANITLGN
jgi:tripartite-type tricarboxylate transporter receptor subunit TctC